MGWFLLRDDFGEFGVFPDSSLLGVFDKVGDAPATFVVIGRNGRPSDLTVEKVWTYASLADALDGLIAEKAEAMRVAMHGTVRNCRVCGCTDDDCSQCIAKTGVPCSWVEDDLCSACAGDAMITIKQPIPTTHAALNDCPKCKTPWVYCPCDSTPDQHKGTDAASIAILGGPCPHCGARSQGNVFNCHACGKPFEGDPHEPDGEGLVIIEMGNGFCVGYQTGLNLTYFDQPAAEGSPYFEKWPHSVWGLFPTREAVQKAVDDAGLRLIDDPRESDGFPAPTGDGTADLQRIDAHLARTAAGSLSSAEANELHDRADAPAPTAAEKLAALPETRQLPIAHGQGLSPLQDGNHPEIEAHRQRLSEAAGDPMASAKALLARKDAKP